jgi:hypothetical protein
MNSNELNESTCIARLGPYLFDRREYEDSIDLLKLFRSDTSGAREEETVEGHTILLDDRDQVVGVTIRGYQDALFESGPIEVTVPLATDEGVQRKPVFLWMTIGPQGMCC